MLVEKRVVREANLISREFACLGAQRAAEATAAHIRTFWAPLLRTALVGEARAHSELFSPIARHAVDLLEPPSPRRRTRGSVQ